MSRIFLALFAVSCIIQLGLSFHLQYVPPNQSLKLHFVPDPQYLKSISGTFRPLLAQAFFMKGALELARNASQKVDYLLALFRTAVQLDARLMNAAFLGGLVVPNRPDDYLKANTFLEETRTLMPLEWRLPYWIGFNYHQISRNDLAADYYQKAAQLPEAPAFLTTNQVLMLYQSQSLEDTIKRAEQLLQSVQNEDSRELLQHRIEWLRTIHRLEGLTAEFKKRFGRWPTDLQELVQQGLLKEIPHDEVGQGFVLESPGDPELGYRVRSNLPY